MESHKSKDKSQEARSLCSQMVSKVPFGPFSPGERVLTILLKRENQSRHFQRLKTCVGEVRGEKVTMRCSSILQYFAE